MSAPSRKQVKPVTGVDGATAKGAMTVTGVIRTTKGFAVAEVVLSPTGDVLTIHVGVSQTERHFIALEHKRVAVAATVRA